MTNFLMGLLPLLYVLEIMWIFNEFIANLDLERQK